MRFEENQMMVISPECEDAQMKKYLYDFDISWVKNTKTYKYSQLLQNPDMIKANKA